jgi:hypothetical protein
LELAWAFYQERFPEFRAKLATASPSLMDAVIVYSCGCVRACVRAYMRVSVVWGGA